jgi:hypothetical protein
VTSVTDDRVITEAEAGGLPVHVETVFETVELALEMSLSTSTREDIDLRSAELTGHLNVLFGQCLGEDEDQDVLALLRLVERHLTPSARPSKRAQAHEAFNYMRDSAVFAKALLSAYEKKRGNGAS